MRNVFITICLLSASGIHAFAQPAPAGSQPIDDVRDKARMHVGPFYVTPLIQLKELGTDSNVFNAAGEQRSDFTATVSPALDVWVPVARRALFTAAVATDLVWYSRYDSERSIDPQASVRAEGYLHRLTLFAQNDFLNTRQRPNHEIDLRSRHVENNALAGAEVRLTAKLSIEAAGRRYDTTYDADAQFGDTRLQRTLNRTTTGARFTARHHLTPLTTLSLRYESLQDRFEFLPSRDSDSRRIMPGVEFKPRALVKGRAFVGHRRFTPRDPVLPAFDGIVADLGLSYTFLGSTSLAVSLHRDLTYSYEETQPFFIDTSPGVSLRRALGRRFDVLVSADRHRYEYRDLIDPLSSIDPIEQRIDTTWNYSGSLGYRIGRDGRIGIGASYWTRESTTARFREYDNLRFGTSATYGF